ncbi:MAG: 5'-methylthioadenosine/S-adenosylhomocysteine nucleosidase [Lachnospiraceae bacterium]|nr:5'-methylthioadenosine/S-adenosylhomocysteine nucleosidase [Lachnospiraceae bacterium]MCR5768864.1 5'-methylthioadenosine/S-adenosylhomocysteine nucleosidase [Lachnospiraceae bacterium]
MTIGMIVAIPQEINALFESFGKYAGEDVECGYRVFMYEVGKHRIIVTGSGAGEIEAAAATQFLITKYYVNLVVNFGVVGGLTPDMVLHRTVVVDKAVHYQYDATPFDSTISIGQHVGMPDLYIPATPNFVKIALKVAPELTSVICASADKFVEKPEDKKMLRNTYGADICDMESAGIMLTCIRNEVPMMLIKAVSDNLEGNAEQFGEMVSQAASTCVNVVKGILEVL